MATEQQESQVLVRQTVTLRDVLTQVKPTWDAAGPDKIERSPVHDWAKMRLWTGFSLASINAVCGEFLDRPVSSDKLAMPDHTPYLSDKRVEDWEDIARIGCWLSEVMSSTVPFSASALGLKAGGRFVFDSLKPDMGSWNSLVHNWYGIRNKTESRALVAGTQNFTIDFDLEECRAGSIVTEEMAAQLRRVDAVCYSGRTDYGFLLTAKQLVVVHFTHLMEITGKDEALIHVMPVPLCGKGANGLTAELALWALCMLALVEDIEKRNRKSGKAADPELSNLISRFQSGFK